jgi:uncharacterized pyridoxal phosphate-containing UPF0001 family protein
MPGTSKHRNIDLTVQLEQVVTRVQKAEQHFGRDPGSVQILAVSKTRPAEDIVRTDSTGRIDRLWRKLSAGGSG